MLKLDIYKSFYKYIINLIKRYVYQNNSHRSPSIYHNKVSSAIYVAESSGKESQVQGVNILIKDHEKVPMTINEKIQTVNDEKLEMTNSVKLQPTNTVKLQTTNNDTIPTTKDDQIQTINNDNLETIKNTTGTDVISAEEVTTEIGLTQPDDEISYFKEDLTGQQDKPVSTTNQPIISLESTLPTKPSTENSKLENSGIISHIQRLIDLNTSMMETIQAQLAAQGNILKSLIEATME